MIKVKFLTMLREIVGEAVIETEKKENIALLTQHLCQKYGKKFREAVLDEKGQIRNYVRFLINGKEASDPETKINDGDTIVMFLPVAGGSNG
ncbi:MAG: MoaD/ThiS family protein [Candidatus Freyarchaeota archaeon]|nr:MoaD/ThiS family protein [Candidatus Jordarchaeia archaeon]MBS7270466.1 MoaD/ThiS family protein [Candidatus Jordarchaeia archaeon]MBS7279072.1 MoaD/ThiS family protein [Candidatus Jordarchaeia archaeon]